MINWDELCSTCGKCYIKGGLIFCSNGFHCCRDCQWKDGRVVIKCADCEEEE